MAVIIDGGPDIISFVVDGKFCDGADQRQFGWGRFSPNLYSMNGDKLLRTGTEILRLLVFNRALRTSEAISSFRSGL